LGLEFRPQTRNLTDKRFKESTLGLKDRFAVLIRVVANEASMEMKKGAMNEIKHSKER
jgi:hypothetical protein